MRDKNFQYVSWGLALLLVGCALVAFLSGGLAGIPPVALLPTLIVLAILILAPIVTARRDGHTHERRPEAAPTGEARRKQQRRWVISILAVLLVGSLLESLVAGPPSSGDPLAFLPLAVLLAIALTLLFNRT